MIEIKLYLTSYKLAAAAFTALAASVPEALATVQTTGLVQQQAGNNLSAGVTTEKQEAARASVATGTAGAATAPGEQVKRGPGRPPKDPAAKANPATPVEALQQAVGEKIDYATSGMPERIAALAVNPDMKAALVALIKQHGGVSADGKTNAKFIPADKLADFRDALDKLDPPQAEEAEEGDLA